MRFFACVAMLAVSVLRVGAEMPARGLLALRCDGVKTPLAVEDARPRLTWEFAPQMGMQRGIRQVAARVQVGRTEAAVAAGRGDVWDSGWVRTDASAMVYGGEALGSGRDFWWKVMVRDSAGGAVLSSAPARFRTAESAWSGRWIAAPWSTERDGAEVDGTRPMPIFRKAFTLREKPVEAVLRIAGMGDWAAWISSGDGQSSEVAPRGLHEAWTDYRKSISYTSVDVTEQMRASGPRAAGMADARMVLSVMLGNGMYNVQASAMADGEKRYTKFVGSFGPPKMIAELRVRYRDGRTEVIGTDATWKVARGPVVFSSTYGGEDFDARREQPGWDRVGFDDQGWSSAAVVDGPGGKLKAAVAPAIGVATVYRPVKVTNVGAGKSVYDLGQNFAGVVDVRVHGPAGAVLKLTPGELLNGDGTVSQQSSGGPMWWSYTLAGRRVEEWAPQFDFYGFRYVQAEWVKPPTEAGRASGHVGVGVGAMAAESPRILSLTGLAEHSVSSEVGGFASSSPMLNAIHQLIVNAMHNNEMSLFTDCPHREKLGWLEETHLVSAGLMLNNDLEGLYAASARNMADAQHGDGMVPTIAPQYTVFGHAYSVFDDSPEWGSASILAEWSAYRFYGDSVELERNYPVMQRYLAYLEGRAKDGIVAYGLGDWYDIGPGEPGYEKNTTLGVTGTLMLYEDAVTMQKIAGLLGHTADAGRYNALARREKEAFQRRFWNAKSGYYDTGSQTANAMPLALGMVPETQRAAVLAHVVADIHAHQDHITTGEVGYPYLLRALMEMGRSDVVMAMMLRKDPPGYGSQLAAGATALTESWDANPKSSQDHFMLGGAEEWFYRGLGGIDFDLSRPDPAERITIRPQMVRGVTWVRCSYRSQMGEIESDWRRDGAETTMDVTVPTGAEATVDVPVGGSATVMEGDVPAEKAVGVKLLRRDADGAVYRVGSGVYRFSFRVAGN